MVSSLLPLILLFIFIMIVGLSLWYVKGRRQRTLHPEAVGDRTSRNGKGIDDGFMGPGSGYSGYEQIGSGTSFSGGALADHDQDSGLSAVDSSSSQTPYGASVQDPTGNSDPGSPFSGNPQPGSLEAMLEPSSNNPRTISDTSGISADPFANPSTITSAAQSATQSAVISAVTSPDSYAPGGFVNQPFLPEPSLGQSQITVPEAGGTTRSGEVDQALGTDHERSGSPMFGTDAPSPDDSGIMQKFETIDTVTGEHISPVDPNTLEPMRQSIHLSGVLTTPPELSHPDLLDPEELFRTPQRTSGSSDPFITGNPTGSAGHIASGIPIVPGAPMGSAGPIAPGGPIVPGAPMGSAGPIASDAPIGLPTDPSVFMPDSSPTTLASSAIRNPPAAALIPPDQITPNTHPQGLGPAIRSAFTTPTPSPSPTTTSTFAPYSIHDGKWTCPACGNEPEIQYMFCTACGHRRKV